MFVDACAIIALLSDEPEAKRVSDALESAVRPMTSAVAVLEAALGLARPEKFGLSVEAVESLILEFLDARGIEILDLPPAMETTRLALSAAHRYRAGRHGLNLGGCLHYACARFYDVPILATADEFRRTDLETVP
jgi:ribonuclease VapC